MALEPLGSGDRAAIAQADRGAIRNALALMGTRTVPPWLRAANPFQDGAPPKQKAAFHAVAAEDLIEIIAARGPLHSIDGWSYLGQALTALVGGRAHTARHLAYYAELRAALSILASAGIGVFNRRNVVVDSAGQLQMLSDKGTHSMAWSALVEWATLPHSLGQLLAPLNIAGASILAPFEEFFPSGATMAGGELMTNWGFDVEQGVSDRDERNWSSYQPTAFSELTTTPDDDLRFLRMFWHALRPNGVALERHLLRNLLEAEARCHGNLIADYPHRFERLDESMKALTPFPFLCRIDDPTDHDFLLHVATTAIPATPYAMISRAGLLLKLATGMAEANLVVAGIQPVDHFAAWWHQFGVDHALWSPTSPPVDHADLWQDIEVALDDAQELAPTDRHAWMATHAVPVMRVCEAERAALWGLFR